MNITCISSYTMQSQLLCEVLRRHNISARFLHSDRINKLNEIDPSALLIPHPLSIEEWSQLHKQLKKIRTDIPLIMIGSHINLNKLPERFEVLKRCVRIEHQLQLQQIALYVRACLQVESDRNSELIKFQELSLDRTQRKLYAKNRHVHLTRKEYFLLELLMTNAGKVITRESIIRQVWARADYVTPNTIDVYISRLRRKIDKYVKKTFIKTVPCLGYQFGEMGTLQNVRV